MSSSSVYHVGYSAGNDDLLSLPLSHPLQLSKTLSPAVAQVFTIQQLRIAQQHGWPVQLFALQLVLMSWSCSRLLRQ